MPRERSRSRWQLTEEFNSARLVRQKLRLGITRGADAGKNYRLSSVRCFLWLDHSRHEHETGRIPGGTIMYKATLTILFLSEVQMKGCLILLGIVLVSFSPARAASARGCDRFWQNQNQHGCTAPWFPLQAACDFAISLDKMSLRHGRRM